MNLLDRNWLELNSLFCYGFWCRWTRPTCATWKCSAPARVWRSTSPSTNPLTDWSIRAIFTRTPSVLMSRLTTTDALRSGRFTVHNIPGSFKYRVEDWSQSSQRSGKVIQHDWTRSRKNHWRKEYSSSPPSRSWLLMGSHTTISYLSRNSRNESF